MNLRDDRRRRVHRKLRALLLMVRVMRRFRCANEPKLDDVCGVEEKPYDPWMNLRRSDADISIAGDLAEELERRHMVAEAGSDSEPEDQAVHPVSVIAEQPEGDRLPTSIAAANAGVRG